MVGFSRVMVVIWGLKSLRLKLARGLLASHTLFRGLFSWRIWYDGGL